MSHDELTTDDRAVLDVYLAEHPNKPARKRDLIERLRDPEVERATQDEAIEEIVELRARLKSAERHCERLINVLAQGLRQ